jgi:hypothetical protein
MFKHQTQYDERVWILSPALLRKMQFWKTDSSWKRWRDRSSLDLAKTQVIVFPLCHQVHWSFFRVCLVSGTINYVTSLGREPSGFRELVRRYMAYSGWWPDEDSKQPGAMTKTPQQSNGIDCGLFLLAGIECTVNDRALEYRQLGMRVYRSELTARYESFLAEFVLLLTLLALLLKRLLSLTFPFTLDHYDYHSDYYYSHFYSHSITITLTCIHPQHSHSHTHAHAHTHSYTHYIGP